MYEARSKYPAFQIPLICIPATISNNVPGTEFCIGADTALNEIVKVCIKNNSKSIHSFFFSSKLRSVTKLNNLLKVQNDVYLLLKQWVVIVAI
jgi:hypothetical protein